MKNQEKQCLNFLKEQQKFCKRLIQITEYHTVNVKISDSQLNKLKAAVKNQKGVTLRINIKIFDGGQIAS